MPDQETQLIALLVDDDEDDRAFFCEAMGTISRNVECVTSKDGVDALDFLRQCEKLPDLIFLDLNMPRMDGRQCLRELKQNKRYGHIPVIVYSTSQAEEDVRDIMQLGAADYIQKPIFFNDIKQVLTQVIMK